MYIKPEIMIISLIIVMLFACFQSDQTQPASVPIDATDTAETIQDDSQDTSNSLKEDSLPKSESKKSASEPMVLKKNPKQIGKQLTEIEIKEPLSDSIEKEIGNPSEYEPDAAQVDDMTPIKSKTIEHEIWNNLLQQYVSAQGRVNYAGLQSDMASLNKYLDYLAQNPVQSSWSSNQQLAYWINAYNAFTVKLIVDNYPVKSIMDLHNGNPWDVQWIELGDNTYSLNQIEHEIIRPTFKDARIHFAVNCAAKSCPPLLNKAWTADNLNQTLDQQARDFINDMHYNKISASKAQLSKIFEWYAEDFGNLIDYLNQYTSTTVKANASVSYLEYNWALNE